MGSLSSLSSLAVSLVPVWSESERSTVVRCCVVLSFLKAGVVKSSSKGSVEGSVEGSLWEELWSVR